MIERIVKAFGGNINVGLDNRPFSKMVVENSNKLKLKTYTSTRKSTLL